MVLPPPLDPARRDGAGDTVEDAPDAAGTVPDLPHPVVGWRTWRVGRRAQRRAELIAPLAGVPWPARQPMVASCGSRRHSPPGDHCPCGLYAVSDPGTLGWGPSDHEVLGAVALWGRIVEGRRGWRASHAYPRFLITGPGIAAEQRAALARRYGMSVHRSEVPPRRLASMLGADATSADALLCSGDADVEALLAARMPDWARRWQAHQDHPDAEARSQVERTGRRWSALGRAWRTPRPPVR